MSSTNDLRDYFDGIDKLMESKGYTLGVIKGIHTDQEERVYSQNPRLDGNYSRVMIEVRKNKEFKFFYTNLPMLAKLQTDRTHQHFTDNGI